MAADISIHGQVRSLQDAPVFMVKVSVYRDDRLLSHEHTGDSGHYSVQVPAGDPVAVRFDTHPTLNNARDWHPSVVTQVAADKDATLDRRLVKVGTTGGEIADLDALAGYAFAAFWTARRVDSGSDEYGKPAAARLSQMKFTSDVLLAIQRTLIDHFESL